jgi:hypothetical protein
MTNSNFLGGERAATYAPGKDVEALGPSDSSDSGSDVQGERSLQGDGEHADRLGSLIVDVGSDSDASGTGERASATGRDSPDGSDIAPDQVIGPEGQSDAALQDSLLVSKLVALLADEDYSDKT